MTAGLMLAAASVNLKNKTMKENELIKMRNKIETHERLLTMILTDQRKTQTLSAGMLEILQRMSGYDKAIKKLKDDIKKDREQDTKESNELIK